MNYGYLNEKNTNPLSILEKFNKYKIEKISHSFDEILQEISKNDLLYLNSFSDLGITSHEIYENFSVLMKKRVNLYFLEEKFLNVNFIDKEKIKILEFFLKREVNRNLPKGRPNVNLGIEDIKVLLLFKKKKISYKVALKKLNIKQTTLYKYVKDEYLNKFITYLSENEFEELEKFKKSL